MAYGSIIFNGSSDYLSIADDANLRLDTGNFTVEAWIYLTDRSYNAIVGKNNPAATAGTGSWWFGTSTSSGYLRLATSAFTLLGNVAVPLNQWNHVAYTRSGNVFTTWLNGVAGPTATNTISLNAGGLFKVGAAQTSTQPAIYFFNGPMYNLRIVKGTAVYTSGFTPPTEPLTAISGTQLLMFTDFTPYLNYTDYSTNNFTLTQNGTLSSRWPNINTPFLSPPPYTVDAGDLDFGSTFSNFIKGNQGYQKLLAIADDDALVDPVGVLAPASAYSIF